MSAPFKVQGSRFKVQGFSLDESEIPMKRWRVEEALREHVTDTAIAHRLSKGKYPRLKIRKVNRRVVFVKP